MTQDLHHLAAAYALDALSADERRDFEAHYPTCSICSADVDGYRAVAARLAEATPAAPPASLRAGVLDEIARTRQLSPLADAPVATSDGVDELAVRRRRRLATVAAGIAAVVALVAGFVTLQPESDPSGDVIAAPDAVVTTLEGEDASLQVVWSAERDQVVVLANQLATVDPGLAYQLWFLLDEGVAPAGLFVPDDDGMVRVVLDVDDIDSGGWGVTVEPAEGSAQPTSDVIFAGTL